MSSEPIPGSPDSFILRLRTQAGTYVKEFVHGDAGRTAPSLGDLLGCRAEIIQLDVTAINDDWNPSGAPRVA
jgi:tRNA pseudouridine synthase 10